MRARTLLLVLALLPACRQDMHDQPKLETFEASAFFEDGRASRPLVEGAVGMVEMALEMLSAKNVVDLDDERRAAMVSNLMVVLCGERDTQPIVNTGSLYQ